MTGTTPVYLFTFASRRVTKRPVWHTLSASRPFSRSMLSSLRFAQARWKQGDKGAFVPLPPQILANLEGKPVLLKALL